MATKRVSPKNPDAEGAPESTAKKAKAGESAADKTASKTSSRKVGKYFSDRNLKDNVVLVTW